jgi:hypothetical protein
LSTKVITGDFSLAEDTIEVEAALDQAIFKVFLKLISAHVQNVVVVVAHSQEGFEWYKMMAMRSCKMILKKQKCKRLENIDIVVF